MVFVNFIVTQAVRFFYQFIFLSKELATRKILNKRCFSWAMMLRQKPILLKKCRKSWNFLTSGRQIPTWNGLEIYCPNWRTVSRFCLNIHIIDRHYRNTYYSFHSSKFMATGRNCIRVHIFDEKSVDINFDKNTITAKEKYLGFLSSVPCGAFHLAVL